MATIYYPTFDCVTIASNGVVTPYASGSLNYTNLTTSATGTKSTDANGMLAQGSITGTAGDIIQFSHATYSGTIRFVLETTQAKAYTNLNNLKIRMVVRDQRVTTSTSDSAHIFITDDAQTNLPPIPAGVGKSGTTLLIPYSSPIAQNLTLKAISQVGDTKTLSTVEFEKAQTAAVVVPASADIAALIHAATGKTTPVDADELALADSAASFVLKKLTWANLKATLKTYLDTLYPPLIIGLWDDRGNFDASGNVFPDASAGGSGSHGAVLQSDTWTISTAGTLGGVPVKVDDVIRARIDGATNTLLDWHIQLNSARSRSLFSRYRDATNSGTARETLYSDQIPAATFGTNGDSSQVDYGFSLAATASAKIVYIKFAGTDILNSSNLNSFADSTAHDANITVSIERVSNTAVRCKVTLDVPGYDPYVKYTDITGLNLGSTAYDILFDGECGAIADATARMNKSLFVPGRSSYDFNVAASSNVGVTISASSEYTGAGANHFNPSRANDGYRNTNNNYNSTSTPGGCWGSNTNSNESLTINFGQTRHITEIDLFGLKTSTNYTSDPTFSDTSSNALTNFTLQYWNGSAWVTIATVSSNTKIWNRWVFSEIATTSIRLSSASATSGTCNVVEFEAWGY